MKKLLPKLVILVVSTLVVLIGAEAVLRVVYDGKFVANRRVLGAWQTVAIVPSIEAFIPGKRRRVGRNHIQRRVFAAGGTTDSPAWIWSGDRLLDLSGYQALKMAVREVGGVEHLFVEVGGFRAKNPERWKPQWYVMKREGK